MAAVLVRQKMLLPISKGEWEEAVPGVVSDLQQAGHQVFIADATADTVDILFVIYEASDQSRIVDNALLQQFVAADASTIGRIVLCACDVSRPRVTPAQVRDVLIAQVPLATQDKVHLREQSFDLFRDAIRGQITRSLFASGLTRPTVAPGSQDAVLGDSVSTSAHSPYSWGDL